MTTEVLRNAEDPMAIFETWRRIRRRDDKDLIDYINQIMPFLGTIKHVELEIIFVTMIDKFIKFVDTTECMIELSEQKYLQRREQEKKKKRVLLYFNSMTIMIMITMMIGRGQG